MDAPELPQNPRDRFEVMYRAEAGIVLLYASHRVGRAAAEDIVAETFAVAWRRLDVVPTPPRAWLLATARRTIANHLRSQGRHPTAELGDNFPILEQDMAETIAVRRELLDAIAQLQPKSREAVILATWYDLSQKDTAIVLGCSTTAAGVRIHRARKALQSILADADRPLRQITTEVPS